MWHDSFENGSGCRLAYIGIQSYAHRNVMGESIVIKFCGIHDTGEFDAAGDDTRMKSREMSIYFGIFNKAIKYIYTAAIV